MQGMASPQKRRNVEEERGVIARVCAVRVHVSLHNVAAVRKDVKYPAR
jgi:hypothetical protein